MSIHIDSFEAVEDLKGKSLTYENLKAAVIKAGRFSIFEATKTRRHAKLYDQLGKDVEIEIDNNVGYPWTLVKKREVPLCRECRGWKRVDRVEQQLGPRTFVMTTVPCPICCGDETL